MKTYVSLALALSLVSTLSAQTVPPALMIEQDGRSVPLGLAKLDTSVRILGSVAETTSTMTFTNPLPRPMEGNLYFPLPEGATISGYALDINGQMVDGVAVEKHEARRVFEEVVRRGIDPGLVEWTKGNNFQTRVFPIPAGGTRTIRVGYVSEMIGGKDAPAYHLPLAYKDKIGEFSLRVEVVKPAAPPKVAKGELTNFAFEKWRESYVAETKQRDWKPVEDLVIALPKTDRPQVLVEKADDGQVYFAVQDYATFAGVPASAGGVGVPASAGGAAQDRLKAGLQRVVVFWDASGSRAGDHKREIVLLQNYLSRLLPDEDSKIAVDLVLFRNAANKPVRLEFSKAGAAALAAELEKVQYDGGTQLGVIGPLAGQAAAGKPDLYLLFTDGISTFGRDEPAKLDAPLYIFSAAATADHAVLHHLANSNGGLYYNLANWKDADILAQAGRSIYLFLSASLERGKEDLYPQASLPPLAGRYTFVGKLSGETVTVSVGARYGSGSEHSQERTYKVSRAEAVEGSLLRRLWAQRKLADLLIHQKRNEKEIAALGKQFGLVTPYTSLLVLDTLEQYVQYDIAPPKSLAAMREEYMRRIDTLEYQKRKQKADKTEQVVRMWEERVKWWQSEFKYAKDFKYKEPVAKPGLAGAYRDALGGMAAPAAPRSAMRVPATEAAPAPAAPAPACCEPAPAARPSDAARKDRDRGSPERPAATTRGDTLPSPYYMQDDVRYFAPGSVGKEKGKTAIRQGQPGIVIQPWQPDMPYLKELQAAKGKGDLFAVYMKNRAQHGTSPAFFLDCADFFREVSDADLAAGSGDPRRTGGDPRRTGADLALQVLSNIAELGLEEPALLRVLGHRLVQIGQLDLAVQTFEQVLELRPEEPQSYRDLALALARRAEGDDAFRSARFSGFSGAEPPKGGRTSAQPPKGGTMNAEPPKGGTPTRADYARALDLLVQVVLKPWDDRFPQIEVIALEELNHILPAAKEAGVSEVPLDPRLIKLLDVDVRIVMTWHADNTDIDLWVTEPSGEKAFYQHNRTTIGGLVSCDFTQGYGPEEYLVRRAARGMYRIEANYYGSRATRLLGAVTVQADVFTNYGRPNEQRKSLTLRLKEAKETVRIGDIEF